MSIKLKLLLIGAMVFAAYSLPSAVSDAQHVRQAAVGASEHRKDLARTAALAEFANRRFCHDKFRRAGGVDALMKQYRLQAENAERRANKRRREQERIGVAIGAAMCVTVFLFVGIGLVKILEAKKHGERSFYNCSSCGDCPVRRLPSPFRLFGQCWGRKNVFAGRAGRKEFWSFAAINGVISSCFALLGPLGVLAYGVISLRPTVGVGVRRFHDLGVSGVVYCCLQLVILVFGALVPVVEWATKPKTGLSDATVENIETVFFVFLSASIVASLFLLVTCMCRGVPRNNRYGIPPDREGSVCYHSDE